MRGIFYPIQGNGMHTFWRAAFLYASAASPYPINGAPEQNVLVSAMEVGRGDGLVRGVLPEISRATDQIRAGAEQGDGWRVRQSAQVGNPGIRANQ